MFCLNASLWAGTTLSIDTSLLSLWRISRQGQWFPGLDMSLRFANRALQQVPAAISQMAEHPCSPVYDDGTKFVSP